MNGAKLRLIKNSTCHACEDWPEYIKQAIKVGLESPTPYEVIPYKNGIGIRKIIIKKSKTREEKMAYYISQLGENNIN